MFFLNRCVSIWSIDTGEVSLAGGSGHTNLVCSMAATPEVVYTLGLDKTCRKVSTENNQYLYVDYNMLLLLLLVIHVGLMYYRSLILIQLV